MKKNLFVYLMVGTLALVAPALMAQTTNSTTDTPAAAAPHKADRQEMMRILGLSREDLKGLSKEERQAKIKDAVKAKKEELEKKKADGTITADESKDLAFLNSHTGAKHAKKAENQ